jgi:hypothetical protein
MDEQPIPQPAAARRSVWPVVLAVLLIASLAGNGYLLTKNAGTSSRLDKARVAERSARLDAQDARRQLQQASAACKDVKTIGDDMFSQLDDFTAAAEAIAAAGERGDERAFVAAADDLATAGEALDGARGRWDLASTRCVVRPSA